MLRCAAAFLLAFILSPETSFSEESTVSEELKVLSNYLGTWDATITSANAPFSKGKHSARWILGGTFLEQEVVLETAEGVPILRNKTLMTYDKDLKAYKVWTFNSNGSTRTAIGKWDASTRTMTTSSRSGELISITTSKFSEDGVEEWVWALTNAEKQLLHKTKGQSRRQPAAAE